MIANTFAGGRQRLIGVALGAIGLAALAALPVKAQYAPDPYYADDAGTTVGEIVVSPRSYGRSAIGAPIRQVSTSRVVRFGDLDLSTRSGMHALRVRIQRAARDACDELDARYPITDQNGPPCYSTAVRDAMLTAEDQTGYAVASAR